MTESAGPTIVFSDGGISAVSQRASLSRAETSNIVLIAAESLASGSEDQRERENMEWMVNKCTFIYNRYKAESEVSRN